jgi:hypothetical protein
MKAPSNCTALICSVLLINIVLLSSCKKNLDFKNFDSSEWKSDFKGCDGKRQQQLRNFDEIKTQLLGIQVSQLIEILGKPNKQELGDRKRRNFMYCLMPGKQCPEGQGDIKMLLVDFDALDRVALFSIKVE